MADTVRLYIDDVEYQVPRGANLVDAAKMVGIDIPVFCYHPKLNPVGMCRMCLVELGQAGIDKNTGQLQYDADGRLSVRWQPKLQTACTTTVTDGMTMRVATKQVQDARDDILEFLLTSHPLDCPICDKGGECPLQNLTLRFGPGQSRFVYDEKMRLAKHVPLGDLIYLDRERCIQCARCTRFQEDLVGDPVLAFHERGRSLQIITTSDPPFDTYFSGNTTDICPVGALTTADFRFSARPWELTDVPSICPHCPVGCNLSLTTRADREAGGNTIIKRVMPRQNEAVNEIWICDKGRFGHHFTRSENRLTTPMIRENGKLVPTTWAKAVALIAEKIVAASVSGSAGDNIGAIAGPMLGNEDLWELRRLVEGAGGKQLGLWPYHMGGADLIAQVGITSGSNFKDMGAGTTFVVIASDLEEEAPVWYLQVKGAVDRGARLIVLNGRPTTLDRWVKPEADGGRADVVRYAYGQEIDSFRGVQFGDTQNLVIFVGGDGLDRARHVALMHAAATLLIDTGHAGKPNSGLIAVWPGANMQGAFDMGYSSEATEAMLAAPDRRPAVLILAGADPVGEDALSASALTGGFTVVSELFLTETAALADVVLPRQSFAEHDGTFTNGARRVQRFYTAQSPLPGTLPDWKVFGEINALLGRGRAKISAQMVMHDINTNVPTYAAMTYPALARTEAQFPDVGSENLYYGGTAYRNTGGLGLQWPAAAESGVPVIPPIDPTTVGPGWSVGEGQLLIVPIKILYDREVTFRASEPLMHTHISAPYVTLNPDDAARLGVSDGDPVRVRYAAQAIDAAVWIDPLAPRGIVLLPRNLSERPAPAVPVAGTLQKVEVMANVSS